jgi:hypothetical protein
VGISIEADVNNLGRSGRADRLPREIHSTLTSKSASPRRRRAGWRPSLTGSDEAKRGQGELLCPHEEIQSVHLLNKVTQKWSDQEVDLCRKTWAQPLYYRKNEVPCVGVGFVRVVLAYV